LFNPEENGETAPLPTLLLGSAMILFVLLSLSNVVAALHPTDTPPLLDSPVFSLATKNADGSTNMNILTYATPVSVRPVRVWALGLFKETLSCDNFIRNRSCVLQLLTDEHIPLVKLLGGASGRDVDKLTECAALGCKWIDLEKDFQVLPNCASYLKLVAVGDIVDAGSHCVAICQVESMFETTITTTKDQHLSTAKLRKLGIITEQGRVAED
jgi:flavin reductase (DIM6/NTAB) family NADH-FMN oxidoreductase RutF